MQRFPLKAVTVAAVVAVAVAATGSLATDTGPWFQQLDRPALEPPDWVFAPVWTVLYVLIVVSAVIAWQRASKSAGRRNVALLYGVNAVLNLGWTLLYFSVRMPLLALIEIVILWLQILMIILYVRHLSRSATLLLVPYLLWVGFAAYLNAEIVCLNPEPRADAQTLAPTWPSAARMSSAAPMSLLSSTAAFTARSASPVG